MRRGFVFLILCALSAGGLRAADVSTHILMPQNASLNASTETMKGGYYTKTWLSTVDTDLAAGNIKSSTTIFGTTGTYVGYTLPDAGRTITSTTTFGEDHDYQPSVSQSSFTIYTVGSSSVTIDNRTGLEWVTSTFAAGISGQYTWEQALSACEGLTFATYGDWRLPDIRELMSIVDYDCSASPCIDGTYFKNAVSEEVMSSTTRVANSLYVMQVTLYDGAIYSVRPKTEPHRVRCVRGPCVNHPC